MKNSIVLRKNPNMVTRVIDDETMLLPISKSSEEINCIYTLNKAGSRIWELIDGRNKLEAIKTQILKEFDATDKEVDKEINKLLKDLYKIKAIITKAQDKSKRR
jgi:hypothetical protein